MRRVKVSTVSAPSIYVVDDAPVLTEAYAILLQASGYRVRAFNKRVEALGALNEEWTKPDLLITDYRGPSIPVDQFLHQCLMVHPALRILMISGFRRTEVRFSQAKPDRFLEKPFTYEDLHREVRAVLAA